MHQMEVQSQFKKIDSVNDVEVDWRLMNEAKKRPGTLNSSYVAGMSVVPYPTGLLHNSAQITRDALNLELNSTFTVFLFCPALSRFQFPSSTPTASIGDRQSGLYVRSVSDPSFYLRTDTSLGYCFPADSVYGTDFSGIARDGFFWASKIKFDFVMPDASLSGAVYTGQVTIQQMNESSPTIEDLISISQTTRTGKRSFSLGGHVINNDLIFSEEQRSDYMSSADVQSEVVNFAVVQTQNINLLSSTQVKYTLALEVTSNWVAIPSPSDTLSQSLYSSTHNNVSSTITGTKNALQQVHPRISPATLGVKDKHHVGKIIKTVKAFLNGSIVDMALNHPRKFANSVPHVTDYYGLMQNLNPDLKINLGNYNVNRMKLTKSVSELISRLSSKGIFKIFDLCREFIDKPYYACYQMQVKDIHNHQLRQLFEMTQSSDQRICHAKIDEDWFRDFSSILQIECWEDCFNQYQEIVLNKWLDFLDEKQVSTLPPDLDLYVSPLDTIKDLRGKPNKPQSGIIAKIMAQKEFPTEWIDSFFRVVPENIPDNSSMWNEISVNELICHKNSADRNQINLKNPVLRQKN
jgi:hypothetical protein